MKRFECEVTRRDTYTIEIDETIMNEEWMEHFKQYFYDYDSYEEHAENIAQARARFQSDFIEGYGTPLVNGKKPSFADEKSIQNGINIKVVSEDNDCYVDVVEVKIP